MLTNAQKKAKSRIIQTRLLGYLEKNGPTQTAELANEIGRSTSVVYNHMTILANERKAHSEELVCTRGRTLIWHLGPSEFDENPDIGDIPVCTQVKEWPPHHFRDPLVAFLFGTATQGAFA